MRLLTFGCIFGANSLSPLSDSFKDYYMKKYFLVYISLLLVTGCGWVKQENQGQSSREVFSNPLPVAFGDPFILYNIPDGKYYLYGTGGVKDGFGVYSSADFLNWKSEGSVYIGNTDDSWDTGDFWAPEVYHIKGKYYMFYSAEWRNNPGKEAENFRIGVAVADKPAGPFRRLMNRPVFDPGYPVIDANVYVDNETGQAYLYYSRVAYKHPVESEIANWARKKGWYKQIEESWVYGVKLKPDFSGVQGEPVLLLRPPVKMNDPQSGWESRSVTSHEVNRRWTEGSVTFKHNDIFYIMYSANFFGGKNYAVGYATSKSPLGPFTKANNNPVLQKNTAKGGTVTGTGHNNIFLSPDTKQLYCVYHARTKATGDKRVVFVDEIEFLPDGELKVSGPDTARQSIP